MTEQERFWSKVDKSGVTGCWLWLGFRLRGYGQFRRGKNGRFATVRAHRLSYEWAKGPIGEGLVVDHLCRNRSCVNPEHLEAVTQRINTLRGYGPAAMNAKKTHCPSGHEYTSKNTLMTWIHKHTRQVRSCRLCKNAKNCRQAKTRRIRRFYAN